MRRACVPVVTAVLVAVVAANVDAAPSGPLEIGAPSTRTACDPRFPNLLDRLPLAFEVNRGQAPVGWDFLVRCRGYHAFVASTGIVFSFDGAGLSMSLDGAAACEPTTRGRELPGRANYFLGNDPSRWVTEIPLVRGATYREATPGTTWSVTGEDRRLEFAFDLAPGVDGPRLRFDGATGVRVADDGSLRLAMPRGEAALSRPVAWQDVPGARLDAAARFVVEKGGAVRIDVTPRDPSRPVHVDPTVSYASYLGGSSDEYCYGAAMDASHNAYLAGGTSSSNFPTTGGAFDVVLGASGTSDDAFVTKVSSSGTLVYSTYLGTSGTEHGASIVVDSAGNAYVGVNTNSTSYPTTAGAFRTTSSIAGSAITELNSTGSGLVFSTYTGGGGVVEIALGPSGSVYSLEGKGIARYTSGGTGLVFYLQLIPTTQNGELPRLHALATDLAGDVYVAGSNGTSTYPATAGAYQTARHGLSDGFVTKLTSGSGTIVYTTYLGGNASDSILSMGVNCARQPIVAGVTTSTNFPVTPGAYRTSVSGSSSEAFVVRFDAACSELRNSTYLGQGAPGAIRVHPSSVHYVVGEPDASTFPVSNGFQAAFGGGNDAFVLKFNRDDTLAWSSFLGGSASDSGGALGMAPDGSVAVGGGTSSTDFPTVSPFQPSRSGQSDGYVLVLPESLSSALDVPVVSTSALPPSTAGLTYSQQLGASGGSSPYAWSVAVGSVPPGTALSPSGLLSGVLTAAGTSTFILQADDANLLFAERQYTVIVNPAPIVVGKVLPEWTRTVPFDQTFTATGGTGAIPFSAITALPDGLSLTSDGRVTGAPTRFGNQQFTLGVTDSLGATATRQFTLRVNDLPSITTPEVPDWTATRPFPFTFQASGGTGALTWSLVSGTLPTTADISDTLGGISGAARPAGTYDFTLRVTDSLGATGQRAFTSTLNRVPEILTYALPQAAIGRPYAASLHGTNGTPPFAWGIESGEPPSGIELTPATGEIRGIALAPAAGPVVFSYTDSCGAVATLGLALDAAEAADLTRKKAVESFVVGTDGVARVLRYLELTEGAVLDLQVSGGASGAVLPEVVLEDHSRTRIDLSGLTKATRKSTHVKGFVVPATSRYFLTVKPAAGAVGKMRVALSIAPPSKWSSAATVGPVATAEFRFSAPPGALVSIAAKAARGSGALPRIVAILDAAGKDVSVGEAATEKGRATSLRSTAPLAGGDYRIVFGTRDLSVGAISWTVAIRAPKTYTFALPDLPQGE